jgi:hypothetical protein
VFITGGKPALKRDTLARRAAAHRKVEEKHRATARELLIQRVKRRVLSLAGKDGKKLSEAQLRRLLDIIDKKAETMGDHDDDEAGVEYESSVIKGDKSRVLGTEKGSGASCDGNLDCGDSSPVH